MQYNPNPFFPHPCGPWHAAHIEETADGIRSLLTRFAAGEVSERHLLMGKDNGPDKQDTLSYWLYFQHHSGSERWKILGQRYWSQKAYASFRKRYFATPFDKRINRRDKGPALETVPKRRSDRKRGLVSEHVVPKKCMKCLLLVRQHTIESLLTLNLCAVITIAEDRLLLRDHHPNPFDPWLRYRGKGIRFIENPHWTDDERAALIRHGLFD